MVEAGQINAATSANMYKEQQRLVLKQRIRYTRWQQELTCKNVPSTYKAQCLLLEHTADYYESLLESMGGDDGAKGDETPSVDDLEAAMRNLLGHQPPVLPRVVRHRRPDLAPHVVLHVLQRDVPPRWRQERLFNTLRWRCAEARRAGA